MKASPDQANLRARGFTLLEAIVAMAIVGIALLPVVAFIGQSARQLTTAADASDRSFATQSAIAVLDAVNPLDEPRGTLPLDSELTLSWESRAIIPVNRETLTGGGLPDYRVGLFLVSVTLLRGEEPWFSFDLRKFGYHRLQFDSPGVLSKGQE